jgi:peptidoglycan/xylan/chitin deacetylase (PgdA/CDA1 family)
MKHKAWRSVAMVIGIAVAVAGFRAVVRARTFQVFGELVDRVETSEQVVALTFDDGPSDTTLEGILAVLATSRVRATFFVIGNELETHAGAGRRLVSAGHELGNHSYSHRRMVLTSPAAAQIEVERTDRLIRATGYDGPILFRPPYGVKFVGLPWFLKQSGRTSVTWDIEPESYGEVASSASAIVRHVLERVRPGSIILLHPWYPGGAPTRQAIADIIQGVHDRGFRFVTISELLRLKEEQQRQHSGLTSPCSRRRPLESCRRG